MRARALRAGARRFRRAETGAAAIEFAVVGPAALLAAFLILDIGLATFVGAVLDKAVQDTGRLIRTGQAASASMTLATFKASICARMVYEFGCSSNLYVSVKVISDVSSVTLVDPVDDDGKLSTTESYAIGSAGDYVLVQAFLPWPSLFSAFTGALTSYSRGKLLLASASLFKNEPYSD